MNSEIVSQAARATLDGSIPFPEVVRRLMETGVAYYHVDYAALSITYYNAAGDVIHTPLTFEQLPAIAAELDTEALIANIRDSQLNGQHFRAFSQRAMQAGVQGYFAFLLGMRVTYFGCTGDAHTEWFPGVKS